MYGWTQAQDRRQLGGRKWESFITVQVKTQVVSQVTEVKVVKANPKSYTGKKTLQAKVAMG